MVRRLPFHEPTVSKGHLEEPMRAASSSMLELTGGSEAGTSPDEVAAGGVPQARAHLLDRKPFGDAFGPKMMRNRPELLASDYESLAKKADGTQDAFKEKHGAYRRK